MTKLESNGITREDLDIIDPHDALRKPVVDVTKSRELVSREKAQNKRRLKLVQEK